MVEETASEIEDKILASEETGESEAETELETAPETELEEETPEEKTYTKAEADEIMTKRIGREKRRLQREFDASTPTKPEKVETPDEEEPNQDDFDSTQEWIKATAKHALKQERKAEQVTAQAEQVTNEHRKLNAKFQKMADKFEDTHPDFWDVLDNIRTFEIPSYINEAVQGSDMGAELTYHLGKNTDVLDKILDLTPSAAIRYLGRLEVQLENTPKPKATSKVPDPIKPLKGGSKNDNFEYKAGDSYEQFYKVRNVEMGRTK
jgi:hypothetical protein